MIKENIKGIYTHIDGDKYSRAKISCTKQCVVELINPNIGTKLFKLKLGSYFECGARICKEFKLTPISDSIDIAFMKIENYEDSVDLNSTYTITVRDI